VPGNTGGLIIVFVGSKKRHAQSKHADGGGEALNAVREGTILGGRYRVCGILGSGGMAVVYEAEDAILGRRVALKTLHDRFANEPSFRARFKQEARAMASLDHGNIVKVYDISQNGEAPFIVAELVEGQDVGKLLKGAPGGRLGEEFVREVVRQLLRALAYAHRRGIIHRDVKPSNILVTPSGVVKVADFGIARIVEDDDREREAEPGQIVGSARYMSPEQLRGEETTPRSDVYSVGVLLYHCLTGRPPFSGDAKSVARQQLSKVPPPPRKLRREISRGMEAVILTALQKDPKDRYPSALAMLDDLQARGETRVFTGASASRRAPRQVPRRKAGRLLGGAAVLVLLLGGGGVAATALGVPDLGGLPLLARSEGATDAAEPREAEGSAARETERSSSGQASEDQSREVSRESAGADEEDAGQETASVAASASAPDEASASAGDEENVVPVPDVVTYFDYSAIEILENRGFQAEVVYEYREGYADRGVAWGTDPAIGTLVPYGSTITVYATPKDEYQPQIDT